jgi:hypothetical protein
VQDRGGSRGTSPSGESSCHIRGIDPPGRGRSSQPTPLFTWMLWSKYTKSGRSCTVPTASIVPAEACRTGSRTGSGSRSANGSSCRSSSMGYLRRRSSRPKCGSTGSRAVARDVPLVAELHRLLPDHLFTGHVGRTVDHVDQPQHRRRDENGAEEHDAGDGVRAVMEDLHLRCRRGRPGPVDRSPESLP